MTAHVNRGMTFERLIIYANRVYREEGRAIIEKQHTLCKPLRDRSGKISGAKYEEKATVDFLGRMAGIPVAFEAKHSAEKKIALARVADHQCHFLQDWQTEGSIGFILISFEMAAFYIIPWDYWRAAVRAREDKAPKRVCFAPIRTEWETTGKASIRMEELPEEWEVKPGGSIGLDYLKTVRQVWGIGAQERREHEAERRADADFYPQRREGGPSGTGSG